MNIETGVPLPSWLPMTNARYPFESMAVMDSFVLPCGPRDVARVKHRVQSAVRMRRHTGSLPKTFRLRAALDPEGGLRVWRTA